MKKSKTVKFLNRKIKNKWYVRILISALIIILLVLVAVLVKFYLDINNKEKEMPANESNIIVEDENLKNEYVVFSEDDGLFGVKDEFGRCIIEPLWENVFFLSDGRFAVERKDRIAVTDSEENFITPFMFKNIKLAGDNFLIADLCSDKGFTLLDTAGNIISDKIWSEFEYDESNKTITLKNSGESYCYGYENNLLICTALNFDSQINEYSIEFSSTDKKLINNVSEEKMQNIFKSSCVYFSSLISENHTDISGITSKQFVDNLSATNFFENCTIKTINNIQISLVDESINDYTLSAEFIYDYSYDDVIAENIRSLVSLHFVEDEQHRIILKSVNKKEL